MAVTFVDRVAARASDVSVLRVVLWLLAAPFWAVGALVGVCWVAVVWAWSAVGVGVTDARIWTRRAGP